MPIACKSMSTIIILNFLNVILIFSWIYSLFIRGIKKDIEIDDLYKCPVKDETETQVLKLEKYHYNLYILKIACFNKLNSLKRNWNLELKKKNPSFMRATLKTFILQMFPPFLIFLFEV